MTTDLDDRITHALAHLAEEAGGFEPDLDDVLDRVRRRRAHRQHLVLAVAAAVVIVAAVGGALAGFGTHGDGSTLQVHPVAGIGPAEPVVRTAEDQGVLGATTSTPLVTAPPIVSPWWNAQTDGGEGTAHELPGSTASTTPPPRTPTYLPLALPDLIDIATPTVGTISPGDVLFDGLAYLMLGVSGIPWDPVADTTTWQATYINVPPGKAGGRMIIAYDADPAACPDVLGVWGRLQSAGGWQSSPSGPFTYGDSITTGGAGRQRYDIPIGDDLVDGGALMLLLRTRPSPGCHADFTVQTSWGAVPEWGGIQPAPTTTWGG